MAELASQRMNDEADLDDLNPKGSFLPLLLETLQIIAITILHMLWGAVKAILPYSLLPKKDIGNELVLITGAASGLGRLLAVRFSELGARLALVDVNLGGLEETKRLVHSKAPQATVRTYKCDLNDRLDVQKIMDRVKTEIGDVDILVNNAGIVTGKKILECPDELMVKTMNVNTLAHFWTIKSVLRSMLNRNHGHIVTIASAAGLTGTAGLVDYCASKFAAVGLTESLALELRSLGKTGVYTTTICPYYINTGMFDGAATKFPSLLPILDPNYAAEQVVNAVLTNQEILIIPRILYFASALKSFLPTQASYRLADFLGITHSMNDFIGRASK